MARWLNTRLMSSSTSSMVCPQGRTSNHWRQHPFPDHRSLSVFCVHNSHILFVSRSHMAFSSFTGSFA